MNDQLCKELQTMQEIIKQLNSENETTRMQLEESNNKNNEYER